MRYTELQLSSDLLDQRFHGGQPRKLLILAPPRTGSYMLCRMMLNAGLGVPHEYFNEIHLRVIGGRFGVPGTDDLSRLQHEPGVLRRYLQLLYAFRTRNGLFAAKIQYKQFLLFLRGEVGRSLFAGADLVYLTRQDVLAQAVSLHFAELTGKWSFEPIQLTSPRRERDFFDVAAIERHQTDIRIEQALWEAFFLQREVTPLRITYEALTTDATQVLSDVAQRGGAAMDTRLFDYDDEGPYPTGPSDPTKAEVIAHCRRLQAAGQGARPTMPAPASPPQTFRRRTHLTPPHRRA